MAHCLAESDHPPSQVRVYTPVESPNSNIGGRAMTELRKRMIESLQLRGLSERTQEAYVRAVRQLAEHYHKSPDLITEEELRQYFLFIKNVKHYSRNTMTIAICGIRFLYQHALNRDWSIFGIVRPAPEKKLPVILSGAEVRKVLSLIRLPRYKVWSVNHLLVRAAFAGRHQPARR